MTPRMLRSIAGFAFALALVLAGIWFTELLAGWDLLDRPLLGAAFFAMLGAGCLVLARRGEPPPGR